MLAGFLSSSHLYSNKLSVINVPTHELSSKGLFARSIVFKREHPDILSVSELNDI